MSDHEKYRFSITIHTDDLALVNCLRALCQHCQDGGNVRISWGGTGRPEWEKNSHRVTFRFKTPIERAGFLKEADRLFPKNLWNKTAESDNDPATPQNRI